ncbi:MAG: glycosyltransferase family 2 protein [Anaerolineales bacterium]|nr:glycosyltransferase family 2 protein [Anaerolineales bacterium]
MSAGGPDLGLVIVNWNVRDLLAACLDSIYVDLARGGLRARVCVVDNGSEDGSAAMVRQQFPHTRLVAAENRGMGAGNNLGLRTLAAEDDFFAYLILNPDTLIQPGALRTLVEALRTRPRAGVIAPKLLNPDGSLQHSGFRFPGVIQAALDLYPPPGRLGRLLDSGWNGRYPARWYTAGTPFRVDHTLGAAFLVRAEALQPWGGELFDESFTMYCEEIDAQWRLGRAGWESWVAPAAAVIHYGGRSTAQDPTRSFVHLWTSRRRLYRRYHGPVVNALVQGLVSAAMRGRIRANHRRSQRGQLTPDRRAELNQMLAEVVQVWQSRRGRVAIDPRLTE